MWLPLIVYDQPMKIRVGYNVINLSMKDIINALVATSIWLILSTTFFLIPLLRVRSHIKKISILRIEDIDKAIIITISLFSIVVYVIHQVFELRPAVEFIVHLLSQSIYLSLSLIIIYLSDAKNNRDNYYLFILLTTILFILLLPIFFGKSAPVALTGYALIYLLILSKLRIKHVVLVTGLVSVLVLVSVAIKYEIRINLYNGTFSRIHAESQFKQNKEYKTKSSRVSFHDRIRNFSSYDPNYYSLRFIQNKTHNTLYYYLARIIHRVNHLGELAYLIKVTPDIIPYSKWHTYRHIFIFFIPRILWKNKPVDDSGQYYGHKYSYLAKQDTTTSVNLNPITEAWMSFGILGIILSAIGFGLVMNIIYTYLMPGDYYSHTIVTTIVIASTLTSEATFSSIVKTVFYVSITFTAFMFLLKRYAGRRTFV